MKRLIIIVVYSILLVATFMVACGKNDEIMQPQMGVLTLSFTGLQDLGSAGT
ncbi:hypothetical protein IIA15_11945, partial [candidate division TA06 bacterium]|nr:hypothetical protein [candidate division TA06 bacterium]